MTPAEVHALVASVDLPEGWTLYAEETRRHTRQDGSYVRSKWRIVATYRRIVRASWDVYRVGAALPAIVEWIAKHPIEPDLVVTTDADGWVKDIEEVGA